MFVKIYHVLVKISDVKAEYRKSFYPKILEIDGCDKSSRDKSREDGLLPIVGCYQGGFVPSFVDLTKYL